MSTVRTEPREASTLIFKIRSCALRSDLIKLSKKSAENTLFSRSDLTAQDRILKIGVLASLGNDYNLNS